MMIPTFLNHLNSQSLSHLFATHFILRHVKYKKKFFLTVRESLLAFSHLHIFANSLCIFWLWPSKD